MTDYAIARRIVDLHFRNMESVERVYATDEIQRYILFARQFKPKVIISLVALVFLVSGCLDAAFSKTYLP